MGRKEIKYIGFYDLPNSDYKRVSNLAATNKMDYISKALVEAGYSVHLVSPSWTEDSDQKSGFIKQQTLQLEEYRKITFCPNFTTKRKITRNIKIIFSLLWLVFWLMRNTKRGEKVLMYHVQWFSLPIRLAKKIKKFHLILEVEEIYSLVWNNKNILNSWEEKLIESAESYIVVSEQLKEKLGNKVKAILYGGYFLPKNNTIEIADIEKDKINIVYAGSIDKTKGGASKAVECMEILPNKYKLHILGGGNIREINDLKEKIVLLNNKLGRIACNYYGVKKGDEYSSFLFQCDIALNPQKEGDYMETAFPSKIISYLSHNLFVVSTPIKSIINSRLNEYVNFSEDDSAQSISSAILAFEPSVKLNNSSIIKELHQDFVNELRKILS